jgi:heptaprenyl diphosphate synthase
MSPKAMSMPQSGREKPGTLALLGSLCLFLSIIEYLIPKPLPFMRIGLANLPLLLALDIFGPKNFFLLALIKVLGQGIIGGTLFSYVFLFSLAGTFASAALMYSLRAIFGKKFIGFAGLGCVGAMASNGVQLLLAHYLIFDTALRYLAPPFLASGFVTGIALGIFCEYFCRHSTWYKKHTMNIPPHIHSCNSSINSCRTEGTPFVDNILVSPRLNRSQRWNTSFRADELFFAGLLMALIFLFGRSMSARIVQFLFFCLLAWLSGKKNNILITSLIMVGIVFFNLLAPYGKILAVIGPLRITEGSLLMGLEKALTLEGLVMLSRACIKSDLRLPGSVGSLLGESLRILELMRERKSIISHGHVIGGIDTLMLEMETTHPAEPENVSGTKPKRNVKTILLLCTMVLLVLTMGFIRL